MCEARDDAPCASAFCLTASRGHSRKEGGRTPAGPSGRAWTAWLLLPRLAAPPVQPGQCDRFKNSGLSNEPFQKGPSLRLADRRSGPGSVQHRGSGLTRRPAHGELASKSTSGFICHGSFRLCGGRFAGGRQQIGDDHGLRKAAGAWPQDMLQRALACTSLPPPRLRCKLRHRHVRLERSEWLRAVRTSSRPVTLDMRPRECGDASGAAVEEGGCLAVTALAAVPQSARCTNLSRSSTAIFRETEEKERKAGLLEDLERLQRTGCVLCATRTDAVKPHFLYVSMAWAACSFFLTRRIAGSMLANARSQPRCGLGCEASSRKGQFCLRSF